MAAPRVVFLDIDGVICCNMAGRLEENKLAVLNAVCKATSAKVVLSTDWRRQAQLKRQVIATLKRLDIEVIGATPMRAMFQPIRPQEITEWMHANGAKFGVQHWVAIDDRDLLNEHGGAELTGHMCRTHPNTPHEATGRRVHRHPRRTARPQGCGRCGRQRGLLALWRLPYDGPPSHAHHATDGARVRSRCAIARRQQHRRAHARRGALAASRRGVGRSVGRPPHATARRPRLVCDQCVGRRCGLRCGIRSRGRRLHTCGSRPGEPHGRFASGRRRLWRRGGTRPRHHASRHERCRLCRVAFDAGDLARRRLWGSWSSPESGGRCAWPRRFVGLLRFAVLGRGGRLTGGERGACACTTGTTTGWRRCCAGANCCARCWRATGQCDDCTRRQR